MGKIKLYDIAKELNLTSKEVLEIAKKLNIEAKSHLSSVSEEDAKRIQENAIKPKKTEEKKANQEKAKTEKNDSPVIIRREVIVNDDSIKPKEEGKKAEKKNNVGFVERKKNKDYNIVYRNKPSKPMTVDELFGIKKEVKKEEPVVTQKVEEKVEIRENKMDVEVKNEKVEEKVINEEKKMPEKRFNPNNRDNRDNRDNRENRDNRNNRNGQNQNDFRKNRFNNDRNSNQQGNRNFDRNYANNGNNANRPRFDRNNRPNNNNNNGGRFDNRNRQGGNPRFNGNRPLDEKRIEKNIKDIMSVENVEKEPAREYNKDKAIDRQKQNNKFDDNRNKKNNKSRKNNQTGEINEHKLKGLKRTDSLSNMFDEQDGGMLDYYDLTTQRGKKGKKKASKNEESRNKQKIFKLEEITIPETITVKDFAAELKKTTAEVIKKLLGYGVMATINNEIDFDTASLIADEFGVKVNKKETVTEEDI